MFVTFTIRFRIRYCGFESLIIAIVRNEILLYDYVLIYMKVS